MNKSTAQELMASLMSLNVSINTVASRVEDIDIDEQKRMLRRAVAGLMEIVYADLMRPIIREHPELDPDA